MLVIFLQSKLSELYNWNQPQYPNHYRNVKALSLNALSPGTFGSHDVSCHIFPLYLGGQIFIYLFFLVEETGVAGESLPPAASRSHTLSHIYIVVSSRTWGHWRYLFVFPLLNLYFSVWCDVEHCFSVFFLPSYLLSFDIPLYIPPLCFTH